MLESDSPTIRRSPSPRLRVLLSAYACEPGKGSEPGTGWNMALALAKNFDVTVLTRTNNCEPIEQALASLSDPKPAFIYHDLPPVAQFLKRKGILSTQTYYTLWQRSLRKALIKGQNLQAFDLFHHITFNSFEVPPQLLGLFPGIKVWGPIGGGQRAPASLTATFSSKSRFKECLRSWRISLSRHNPRLIRYLESCDVVLFANQETQDLFIKCKLKSSGQMIDVGVDPARFTPTGRLTAGNRIFSAGNFEARKGSRLLLLAFQQAHRENPMLRLRLAGDGPELPRDQIWVEANGLNEVITFSGRRSHHEMAEEFADADVFVFPSIRDTSGAVVLEAMACGLPVVCLDHQGARLMVGDGGIRVPPGTVEETVDGLARAIQRIAADPELRTRLGQEARRRAAEDFSWDAKFNRIVEIYKAAARG